MRSLILLITLLATALAAEVDRTIDIFAWPLSAAKPQTFAKITYSYPSLNASITSHTKPTLPDTDSLVRVGFFRSSSGSSGSSGSSSTEDWTGILTSAQNFDAVFERKLRLIVDAQGDVFHVGYTALYPTPGGAGAANKNKNNNKHQKKGGNNAAKKPASAKSSSNPSSQGLQVEVVRQTPGPQPHLSKPVVVNPEGKVEEGEPEKSFLQKYWWVVGLFLLMQVVMGGGGDK